MPMYIQSCLLRADGPIYYATREIGRLYETGDHLHNYALTYVLGFARSAYHADSLSPTYREQLGEVSTRGVYVTPGTPRHVEHMISSLKFGKETWHEDPGAKKTGNYPRYGRIKEIAPGSEFAFYVLSPAPLPIPHWVRVGVWMTKCEVTVTAAGFVNESVDRADVVTWALNPLDLATEPRAFDIVPMPPNSLIRHTQLIGRWWTGELAGERSEKVSIPSNMSYLSQYTGIG